MRNLLIVVVFLAQLTSCSTPRPGGKTEAEVLYKEAQSLMEAGRFILATEKLNRIRSKYPYSYYATFAELMAADVLFKQENYAEAAAAYIVFKDFHPKHKKADYVLWKIGESFFNQMPDTYDRDLSPGFEAIKYYKELKRIHASSDYAKQADEKIAKCEEMIRLKEKYIADFYFKTDVFDAARFRYENIIEEFQEPQIRSHAIIRTIKSSTELGDPDYCRKNKDIYAQLLLEDRLNDFNKAVSKCLKVKVAKKEES